ncbi:type IV toxin-antitoxin system YeeU family antitoxin [Aeromonas veronii]|uniref:type IV toxin-antitoxin system YeeU family antitoxin n=1 Tax=Aeromonas veronii TaxID=654 RepID=UPI0022454E41|nr:type IV toxin-antitoxin system YeeU family antitoxin [Aeromonas veronii]MCX0445138.1 type IV toxin-antitoxin system YeeU family antitoxin [Aeromonas veronii]
MTTTTTHTQDQQHAAADQPTQIFAQWGLPHTVTPRFGARLIQEHHRLYFLSDRASLVGEWEEEAIDQLEAAFPAIIKELESKLLIGELDARRQQRITVHHSGFTCEADTLGSHGYVYVAIYLAMDADVNRKHLYSLPVRD